jgi:hypothetical protein
VDGVGTGVEAVGDVVLAPEFAPPPPPHDESRVKRAGASQFLSHLLLITVMTPSALLGELRLPLTDATNKIDRRSASSQ